MRISVYTTAAGTILVPLKTIRSHSGFARFLAETTDDGEIERSSVARIPSPYHFSPTWVVYAWNGKRVIVAETSHKVYQVFNVASLQSAAVAS